MTDKLFFDTLKYATMLNAESVQQADGHARALASALSDNLYTKGEIDMVLSELVARIDQRFVAVDQRFARIEQEMIALEMRMQKAMHGYFVRTIAILSSLIILVESVGSLAQHLIR